MMFFMLPAWGLSNAVSTLVGQNLGAKQVERAEQSVFKTAKYIVVFMALVTLFTFVAAPYFISFFTNEADVQKVASNALKIMSVAFIIYGIGMVLINTFNGAGDTWTPTKINFFGFWLFQIPLAFFLARYLEMGPLGVFIAIPVAETAIAIAGYILFKKGKWKRIQV